MSVRSSKQNNNPAKKNDQKGAPNDTKQPFENEASSANLTGYAATAAFAAVLIGILATGNQFEGALRLASFCTFVIVEFLMLSTLQVVFLRGTKMVHVDREPKSTWWRNLVS